MLICSSDIRLLIIIYLTPGSGLFVGCPPINFRASFLSPHPHPLDFGDILNTIQNAAPISSAAIKNMIIVDLLITSYIS